MKLLLIISLILIPLKTVFNDEFCNLIIITWHYESKLKAMQKAPLKRGETRKGKQKRTNRLKNKIEVLKYQQMGYKLNPKHKNHENF